ncbi:MAG: hypothetical protein H6660_11150 [Ardenticatenaceae bacterium]|nr:hypothetical protein [Ardenticatenaceae bacterium]
MTWQRCPCSPRESIPTVLMVEWKHPFLEQRPYIRPSLNQARIVDLPGVHLPWDVRGKTGYQLLSSHFWRQRILAAFPELAASPDVFRAFDRYLADGVGRALLIGEEYGRSLGYLLLMLKRGDAVNRVVRPDWQAVHWQFWREITTIWLGGGLMAGHLGQLTAATAQAVLHRHHFPEMTVSCAPYAAALPLMGVARAAPAAAAAMLVFDFGQTSLKRAVAVYDAGQLLALHPLPAWPAACTHMEAYNNVEIARHTAVSLLQVMAQSWQEAVRAGWQLSPHMAASIACYLVNGHPALPWDMGCYGRLQLLTPHLPTYLAAQVSELVGSPLKLQLFHDGTAAALTYAAAGKTGALGKTAVLTLGTAIGNGFPPAATTLRPIHADFQLVK